MRRAAALALVLAACGGASPDPVEPTPEEEPVQTADPEWLPTPYTAEQIAEACAPGRWSLYEEVDAEGATTYSRTSFVEGEPGMATFESVATDAEGEPTGEPRRASAPWEALRDHARYAANATTVSDATIELPSGTWETRLYRIQNDDGTETHAWFAPSLPGPPVRHVVQDGDGHVLSSMTLIAFHDPR